MAKFTADVVLDAPLDKIATATRQTLCSAQPADFAGIAAVQLADVVVDSGDFTKGPGDVSGRKLTVAAQSGVPVDTTGEANHACLDDGTTLLHVTTIPAQTVTAGNTANIAAYDVEFADVTP